MRNVEAMKSFLEALGRTRHVTAPAGRTVREGINPFITISRETGAGGHTLACALIDLFEKRGMTGWRLFDAETCRALLADKGLWTSFRELASEEFHSAVEDALLQMFTGRPPQEIVYNRMFAAIRTFAVFGKVIVLGRGGACITANLPKGTHVRLVAPPAWRMERLKRIYGWDEKQARRYMIETDASRSALVRRCFNRNSDDPLLYDLTINVGRIPINETASLILEMVQYSESAAFA